MHLDKAVACRWGSSFAAADALMYTRIHISISVSVAPLGAVIVIGFYSFPSPFQLLCLTIRDKSFN